jgi:hypothetical protein
MANQRNLLKDEPSRTPPKRPRSAKEQTIMMDKEQQ